MKNTMIITEIIPTGATPETIVETLTRLYNYGKITMKQAGLIAEQYNVTKLFRSKE